MDKYPHIVELLAVWESQAAQALPSDAVLLREQIRQLREALVVTAPAAVVIERPHPLNIRVECDHLFFKRRNCPGCYEGVEPGKEPYR